MMGSKIKDSAGVERETGAEGIRVRKYTKGEPENKTEERKFGNRIAGFSAVE